MIYSDELLAVAKRILKSGARWQDLPGEVSASFDVLAAIAGLGRARRVVENLAGVP